MVEDSLLFTQQVIGEPRLDDAQIDELVSRMPLRLSDDGLDEDAEDETVDRLRDLFGAMSGASQRLLVRGLSLGFLSVDFVEAEIHRFDENVLGDEWSGADGYASLPEAMDYFDARLSSILLVWEQLGSSLEPLGNNPLGDRDMAGYVLNGYREYSSADELRLSTVAEVEEVAALVTYAVSDLRGGG